MTEIPSDPTADGGFPDTPGPEATPEQDAFARSMLGLLRADDIPIPDDLVARLGAALALERHPVAEPASSGVSALGAAWAGQPDADDDHDPDDATAPARLATVTVLPAGAAGSRRGPSLRALQIVGGVAAAALVVVGGIVVVGGLGLRGGSSSTSASSAAPAAAAGERSADAVNGTPPRTVLSASGTNYTAATLEQQAGALAAAAKAYSGTEASVTPESLQGTDQVVPGAVTPTATPPTSRPLGPTTGAVPFTAQTVTACVRQLTGVDGVTALAVDRGTYEGKPVDVVVLPTPGDPSTLDVWVIKPGCTATDVTLYVFRPIPAS